VTHSGETHVRCLCVTFSGWGQAREAALGEAWAADARVTSWSWASSLGLPRRGRMVIRRLLG
jgi:hypothetical protein